MNGPRRVVPPDRIPLADAAGLRRQLRRARLVQLALAAGLIVLLAAAVAVAVQGRDRPARVLPSGASVIAVVDVSSSIRPQGYRHVGRTLREAAAGGGRYGLVFFSDTAYEALPPGTRAAELRRFAGLFTEDGRVDEGQFGRPNPWRAFFTGGTRLSSGLELARELLERDGIEDGAVLLVSDLATDTSDLPRLSRTLIEYERAGLPLKVVSLGPLPDDVAFFERMLRDPGAVIERPRVDRSARVRERADEAGFPVWLVALGAGLLGALALNELWCGRLTWRTAP